MIEFALLFGLGFLAATFLVLLIAPAVHRRVVGYTENRLKATMPLSPQEVRAQKDMVRALYAAENARATQGLIGEREKAANLLSRAEMLSREASRLASENSELQMQINAMNVEAADMRSRLRREDLYIDQLKSSLHASEEAQAASGLKIDALAQRANRLAGDADSLKIDLAARETELESLKFRLRSLREERETLNQDLKVMAQRAKDAEARLSREEHKILRLEDKLAREHAASADKDSVIERRQGEIERLKEKLKAANASARDAARALRAAGIALPAAAALELSDGDPIAGGSGMNGTGGPEQPARTEEPRTMSSKDAEILSEDIRNRAAVLAEGLPKSRTPQQDAVLREEMADVAARMVALTAAREGPSSPIHAILTGKAAKGNGERISLAERAIALMDESKKPG
ncbi:hypothetical protein MRS76_01595 [Rhizobiaceae bacterium n13]|uniref:Chromosome segregation ATPase n=1 Tax=Ferirhizobium litorale TaxID=2927786 RepID=A0AAE3Q9H5_9HYPH|nr:hypothetical protein [Fererhizobium litorale]MDI7860637.1 hypothetical protein [Fererhizobium litorale]MDI7920785.1 hypothetical protein [Fererhizobium litorale]